MKKLAKVILLILPFQVAAQDYTLEPHYGSVSLHTGFDPDPHKVSVNAGGRINLSRSREFDCVGFVSNAPDYRLDYSSITSALPLSFFALSDIDTVLLVNSPDTEWHCNDDYSDNMGVIAGIEFQYPSEGIYDIWIGVYSEEDKFSDATLLITEIGLTIEEFSGGYTGGSNSGTAIGSGTAFVVSESGHLITNHHVVSGCSSLEFQIPGQVPLSANIVSTNEAADLALLATDTRLPPLGFDNRSRISLGNKVVVFGFPLRGNLSSQGNLTQGVVSALMGINDDLSKFQMSAQVQPGNSGGPVLDNYGNIAGVVVSVANDEYFLEQSGSMPQNVNFAIRSDVAQAFLASNNIEIFSANSTVELSTAEIAEIAQQSTGSLLCLD